jgi:hypothetical protein
VVVVVVVVVVLANAFGVRDRLFDAGAGDANLPVCGFGVGNFAVTADAVFRCTGVGFVFVNNELIFRDKVERIVSVCGVFAAAVLTVE